jgi:hypothetical protein
MPADRLGWLGGRGGVGPLPLVTLIARAHEKSVVSSLLAIATLVTVETTTHSPVHVDVVMQ